MVLLLLPLPLVTEKVERGKCIGNIGFLWGKSINFIKKAKRDYQKEK
jgi:hypothetical protein